MSADCSQCSGYGWVVGEDHVSREICPSPSCAIPPVRLKADSDVDQAIAMQAFKVKMRRTKRNGK